jgi:hypothetical protein
MRCKMLRSVPIGVVPCLPPNSPVLLQCVEVAERFLIALFGQTCSPRNEGATKAFFQHVSSNPEGDFEC